MELAAAQFPLTSRRFPLSTRPDRISRPGDEGADQDDYPPVLKTDSHRDISHRWPASRFSTAALRSMAARRGYHAWMWSVTPGVNWARDISGDPGGTAARTTAPFPCRRYFSQPSRTSRYRRAADCLWFRYRPARAARKIAPWVYDTHCAVRSQEARIPAVQLAEPGRERPQGDATGGTPGPGEGVPHVELSLHPRSYSPAAVPVSAGTSDMDAVLELQILFRESLDMVPAA